MGQGKVMQFFPLRSVRTLLKLLHVLKWTSLLLADPYDFVIKRLVGIEGDIIENSDFSPREPVELSKGFCWVEGDNRHNSVDSNSNYGPISKGLIFGKATHVIWPPKHWRRLHPDLPEVPGRDIQEIGEGRIRIVNK